MNFFINFFVLQITAKLCKKKIKVFRIIASSAIGGFYSLIILIDKIPIILLALSKIFVALIMVLVAFDFYRVKSYLCVSLTFLFSSLIMLGVIVGAYFITKSKYITINNSVVYFDIDSKQLVLCSFLAYLISCVVVRMYNRSLSKSEIYTIEIENMDKCVSVYAFADSGNRLREPFSNFPVIIVKRELVESMCNTSHLRLIPTTTVNNSSMLQAFKPDKITIKGIKNKEVIENAYIAMSDEINSDSFSAIINPEILSV